MSDTIYALSTGTGRAGLAVIRLSGSTAADAVCSLTRRELPVARTATRRRFLTKDGSDVIDEGLLLWFPGPNSFTGEDVAEFHVHGGTAVIDTILSALGDCLGTRLADPGEFTKRAFLNNKMDLTAAEGLADLIDAETASQRRQALRQSEGALGEVYEAWRQRLITCLAHIEAAIDFPEEDLSLSLIFEDRTKILRLIEDITQYIDDSKVGERLRNGIEVAIVGPPNSGKSSLLNVLAGREAAIVSEIAGTTRDVIEVRMDLGGFPVTLSDTAGIREASNEIEAEGIRRGYKRSEQADIRVIVFDAGDPSYLSDKFFELERAFTILNKMDMVDVARPVPVGELGVFEMSLRTGIGLDSFVSELAAVVSKRFDSGAAPLITRARHREAAVACLVALRRALETSMPELIAEDLRLAMRAIGRVTGSVDVEDLLDIVFQDFCIGK